MAVAPTSLPPLSLTGGAAAPSGVQSRNQVDFGSVLVMNGGNPFFWIFLTGAGYVLWKTLKK